MSREGVNRTGPLDRSVGGDVVGAALVTGGARRIGAAICRALAEAGHSVAIHCHNSVEQAEALAAELRGTGVSSVVLQAEFSDIAAVSSMVEAATDQLGGLDILVNNASTFEYDDLDSLNPETFERTLRVNALAPLILSREFAAQVPENGGVIVNLLDQKLANPNPDYLSYTTSKHALAGLTRSLSIGLAPSVRVNGIAPGLTLPSPHASQASFDEMHSTTPLGRGSTPEDVASAVLFLVGANAVTGEVIHVDGGEHLAPRASDVLYGRGD